MLGRRVGGLVVGALAALLAGCEDGPPVLGADDIVTREVTDVDAAADFVAAYERSRTATYVLEQTWQRSVEGAPTAPVPLRIVQRPPDDRLEIGGGTATGTIDGQVVRCNVVVGGAAGEAECLEGGPAGDDDVMVAAEVAEVAELVEGDSPAYAVARGDEAGCFDLTLRLAIAAPPYGLAATFCFDEATGAVRRRAVDHGEGITDEFVATAIRAEVTDADLAIGSLGSLPETPEP